MEKGFDIPERRGDKKTIFKINIYFNYYASDFIEAPQGELTIKMCSQTLTKYFEALIFDKDSIFTFIISNMFEKQVESGRIEDLVQKPVVMQTFDKLQNIILEVETLEEVGEGVKHKETIAIPLMVIPFIAGKEICHPFIVASKNLNFKFTYEPFAEQISKAESEKNWGKKLDEEMAK